jgi:hypothetical protein
MLNVVFSGGRSFSGVLFNFRGAVRAFYAALYLKQIAAGAALPMGRLIINSRRVRRC